VSEGALVDPVIRAAAREQDARLREQGVEIWIGTEPTFTRADSQAPWWLGEALGGDKLEYARRLLCELAPRLAPDAELLRVVGRRYPGESAPRFALAALWSRDHLVDGDAFTPLAPRAKAGLWPGGVLEPLPSEPPRVAPHQAYLTITPDPGVVEVNMAPAPDLDCFARWSGATYAAAEATGLSTLRFRYNGELTDSGGGGQLTFGGPTPERSPFFTHPQALPRLLVYLNRHPALSYWFSSECCGSASQGPRPDEGARERFEELCVTVERLRRRGSTVTRQELGGALSRLLVDASGNAHRAELNVEKLWTPGTERGCLGLVELRALRMEPTATRAVAVALLLRAVVARCALADVEGELGDWGGALHDRYALPSVLALDLRAIFDDLSAHGLGLGAAAEALLGELPEPWCVAGDGPRLTVRRAKEFWPLVGDVASQESRGSRVVDSSTERVELRVEAEDERFGAITAHGEPVPLQRVAPGVAVCGLRRRTFVPSPGLHPGLEPLDPLVVEWQHASGSHEIALHGWRPGGGAYAGLPKDASEARQRRDERAVARAGEPRAIPDAPVASSRFTVDLRLRAP
jgi:uncharacterized protein (DUF2126 family)